jgi:hypothetical protein
MRNCLPTVTFSAVSYVFNGKSGSRDLYGCEILRIPRYLDTWLRDGGEVVSLKRRTRSTPHELFFSAFGTHFSDRLNEPQRPVRLEGLCKLKKN